MKFKNFKISYFLPNFIVGLLYPILKCIISDYNKLLIFTDTLTIMALIMLIVGIIYRLVLKGDFDTTHFVITRSLMKSLKTKEAFLADEKYNHENSFNYPLFVGLIYILAVIVIILIYF